MTEPLEQAVGAALESQVAELHPLSGGDINDAYAATLADGRKLFIKTHARAPRGMYPSEASGLAWLAEPQVIRVPEVLCVREAEGRAPAFLVLELIESARPASDYAEQLGRQLAALHQSGAQGFGWPLSNFIGSLPQDNTRHDTWPEFYRAARLLPQLNLAIQRGRAKPAMRDGFERLFARLDDLAGDPEPPARLHGDLWGGNAMRDECGKPCLIDPAPYGGHREMDLSMMRLFGGFVDTTFDAYAEAFPLSPGARERVPLYQLYPLMVHVNLFGGQYIGQVESILARY